MNDTDQGRQESPAEGTQAAPQTLRVEISATSVWQAVGVILVTLAVLWALDQARGLVWMLVISFFFSLALEPAVRYLSSRFGWRRGASVGVIYLAGTLFMVFLVLILIPAIAELARTIGEQGATWLNNISDWTSENLGVELPRLDDSTQTASDASTLVEQFGTGAFGTVVGIATSGIGLLFNLATIAMFTFYLSADAPRLQRSALRLFSPEAQEQLAWTWDEAITQTGGYFYSRTLLMLINSAGFFITMVAVGMPVQLAIPLAIFGGFISAFIPAVGTYIGGAVPIVITLAVQGWVAAAVVLGYVLVYQQLENYYLSPKISSNTMSLNGGLAFGSALAGGAIAGPMGAFMALPVAALIVSFTSNYLVSHEVAVEGRFETGEEAREARLQAKEAKQAARKAGRS